ncbi:diacylglycerol/lipid kinase family protein [Ancylobacter oerskovii]|uniref:Diacylglycerol/lipid kinase family protein n=1 Tax=Ancylobacter oerskovii TaxID=459519 RepID=A0ABW4YYM6_9HYPH|nr:diacylglycerol kinase family protein [Ancylobacter oerskovii]MBS7541777.1 diacylglycerol kinase [Ancylobacter oerskovii]
MRHVLVLLNAKAGTLQHRDGEAVCREVVERLSRDGREVEVRLLAGEPLLRAIRASGRGPHDTVIVGGGDGSVSLAARCHENSGKALGILPLGTMNLLARDIGMPTDLGAALDALDTARPHRIDMGTLNGRRFHTISGFGFFSQMARARETARRWGLGRFFAVPIAAFLALRRTGRIHIDVEVDGRQRHFAAFSALITVNRFTGPGWHRGHLDDGLLEVHIAEDRGALARLKAGADMVTDSWRDNPGIISLTGRDIVIRRGGRRRTWVSTDGELARERLPLHYRVMPQALELLIPETTPQRASIS